MFRPVLPLLLLAHNALSQSSFDSIVDGPGGLTLNPAGEYDMSQVGNLASDNNQTYMNPIMTVNGGDPWMTTYDDWYLMTFSTNDNITLKRSHSLTANWDYADTVVVFNPDPDGEDEGEPWSTNLWAPEIHNINDRWYIIFSATPDRDNPRPLEDAQCPYRCPAINHRMFILESDGPDPWESNYTLRGELETYDQFAIDGTYFSYRNELYHIYSCWEHAYDGWPASLCITHLSDPLTTTSSLIERRLLSVPTEFWEQVPPGRFPNLATNEGPAQLTNPYTNQTFVVYSGARVNTPFYCLGYLELTGTAPLQPSSWRKNRAGCAFHQNPDEGIYGTGHASFVRTLDGSETYVVYHALTEGDPEPDLYRTVRAQKIEWNDDGTPRFPEALRGPFAVPSS